MHSQVYKIELSPNRIYDWATKLFNIGNWSKVLCGEKYTAAKSNGGSTLELLWVEFSTVS
jgi:hypothetical protein